MYDIFLLDLFLFLNFSSLINICKYLLNIVGYCKKEEFYKLLRI